MIHKGRALVAQPSAWTLLKYCTDLAAQMSTAIKETQKVAGVGGAALGSVRYILLHLRQFQY